jgi:hypothetical protein
MCSITRLTLSSGAALLIASAAAHADVTINATTAGKASFINVGGDGVTQIRDNRMRTDQGVGNRSQVVIIDIDGKRFINLEVEKKSATITPLDAVSEQMQKMGLADIQATLKPTAEVKQVAGYSCTVNDVNVSFPFSFSGQPGQGMDVTLVLAGTVCLSKDVPGLADYQRFYTAAADSGFIFGDPRAAKSPAGAAQARAYAALMKKMAEGGMALESHVSITSSGSGPVAAMMASLAKSDITTTVTAVKEGELPADSFDIPAGYKVKTQK